MPKSILDDNNCWILQITPDSGDTAYHARAYVTVSGTTTYGDEKDAKLSDLESGISLIANLEGFEQGTNDILASLMSGTNTITYYPNGGNGDVMTQVGISGQEVTLNANTFTHTSKPFDYWNTKADGTGTSYEDKASVTLTADLTLYAQWKEAATVSETSEPTAKTLTYSGAAQELVTAGTPTGGTIQYALGNDATNAPTGEYSATIPTGTNAGTYYVWYKVAGDDHHTDSAPACVTVTINKAEISPTVTMSGWTYGGTASNPGVTSGNRGNGSVTYAYKLKTAEDEAYNSTKPTAAGTYKVRAVIAETNNYFDLCGENGVFSRRKLPQFQENGFAKQHKSLSDSLNEGQNRENICCLTGRKPERKARLPT